MPLKKILIANRGEIAVRIIRACHEEGMETVAVYSSADRGAYHVRQADEAVEIGPPAPSDSYLHIERIVEAAVRTGCDAIHPGYGFLAERPTFVNATEKAGLVFVGPSSEAMSEMGDKTRARSRMKAAGVPIVPGTTEALADAESALEVASQVGFPVMLKASAGGGGKGMRVVHDPEGIASSFEQASSEATQSFGDGAVYLEKFVERPRHVEIQILADNFGNVVHFGERECSIQRRHQKLLEECPSPAVDSALRHQMGQASVRAAQAVGYSGAGTVEFLLDRERRFYFLEMNTRIQVEHPITELVYGVDLLRWQLRVAGGEKIDLDQDVIAPQGHAIECRIIAEDPSNNFVPSPGHITCLDVPGGPGVRWDGGVEAGDRVELFYDPMIAKLIVFAEDRDAARTRMHRALGELLVAGVRTSQGLHRKVVLEEAFASGDYDIGYLEQRREDLLSNDVPEEWAREVALAAVLAQVQEAGHPRSKGKSLCEGESPWLMAARQAGLR